MKSRRNGLLYLSASLVFGAVLVGIAVSQTENSFVQTFSPFIAAIILLCLVTGALIFLWWFISNVIWKVINTPKTVKDRKEQARKVRGVERGKEIMQKLEAISNDRSLSESQKTQKAAEVFKDYSLARDSTADEPPPLDMTYKPNQISLVDRVMGGVVAIFLLVYGGYGIYINDLALPTKRGKVLHLHDGPALMHYGAFICATLVIISMIIDHYDKRDNEHKYQIFAQLFKYIGWTLFGLSLMWNVVS